MHNKLLFIGYQIVNLIFQLCLIPFLYHSISLSEIGEIILLVTISQVLINFISSGASILGVSRVEGITTSSIFTTQLILGSLVTLFFSLFLFFYFDDKYINTVFSVYVFSSSFSLYWNYIYHQRYIQLFVGNLCAKFVFVIFVMTAPISKLTYSIAISLEYISLLMFFILYEKEKLFEFDVNRPLFFKYIKSSCNRIVGFSSLQVDKLIVSAVFGLDYLAIYNFIYKIVDVPTNLLIQFNYIFMSRMKEIEILPKIFITTSVVSLALMFLLSDYISYYITDNQIQISNYLVELSFLSVLIATRTYYEYISFTKFYNFGKYIYPGLAIAISIIPYAVFIIFPIDFRYFFLTVALCSVFCVFIMNPLEYKFIIKFILLYSLFVLFYNIYFEQFYLISVVLIFLLGYVFDLIKKGVFNHE